MDANHPLAQRGSPFRQPGATNVVLRVSALAVLLCAVSVTAAVKAAKKPVVNEYHGVKVTDDYQWLENAADPAVRRWSDAQNKQARAFLDKLPTRPSVEYRLGQLLNDPSTNYYALTTRRGRLFLLKFQPPAQQPVLITLSSVTNLASEQVILDLNQLDPKGGTTIDWFVPSPDGRLVAVSLSENGSESGTLYLYDTATGQRQADVVPRVHGPTAGGSAAWNGDGTGIFYTRYPRAGERAEADLSFYQQVYFHKLGAPTEQDTYEVGKQFPRIAEIELEASPDGRRVLASVANGDGGEHAHYLREPSGQWRQVTRFTDQIARVEFGRDPLYIEAGKDDALYLLSHDNAPKGKILRLPFSSRDLSQATVVVAQGTNVIKDFRPSASGLALVFMDGGPSEFAFLDYFDNTLRGPRDRDNVAVQEIVVGQGDEVLYRTVTHTQPYTWWRFNPSRDRERAVATPLVGDSPADFGDIEVVREMVPSKDGTKVPLSVLRKKGMRFNGENPTILSGYGGYNISMEPRFDPSTRVWFDQGGVLAIANLRGGGEFGEDWHLAGNLTNKQNVFDDFAACAEFLIRSNYTKPSKLAIRGGSNGGLLMGALLTQRPDLAQTVVSHVGLYDMLRVELDPNGAFNVTEFGSVRDPAQFRALHAYSPFHRVKDGGDYPAVLMLTGEHDGRANPAHSRKMTARLQAATASKRPVLLRTSAGTGHGIGTALSERIQELTDVYAFLFDRLGVDYSLVDRGPLVGAVTPASARVKAKLAREGLEARLVVSKSPLLTRRSYVGRAVSGTNHYNIVDFPLSKLEPDTKYYYAVEIDGRLERAKRGSFRTLPGPGPASFQFGFASCARTGSASESFDRIRENDPLFFLHMGDFQYLDIRTNSRALFRAAYDSVLASPSQSELYRNVPLAYVWDDHDFGGNNANRRSDTQEAARLTYEEFMPHYPLVFDRSGPIAQTFSVGRVKFILTDLRSDRDSVTNKDDEHKTILGDKQKEWFKRELLEANGKYPLIVWMSSVPWIGRDGTNVYRNVRTNEFGYIHHAMLAGRTNAESRRGFGRNPGGRTNETSGASTNSARAGRGRTAPPPRTDQDHWSVFSTERREIADFIKSNHIQGLCILHGDSHMIAADDGSNADYATGGGAPIPVMCGGPLDQDPSLKGGPYSQGVYKMSKGESGFGWMRVDDRGDRIDVTYSGRNHRNEEKISLKFTVPALPTTTAARTR
jgi:prolyl oligopeptidase